LHGHLKNEGKGTNAREEELGSSSYVNPDKAKETQLVYALDFLRGVLRRREEESRGQIRALGASPAAAPGTVDGLSDCDDGAVR
jgi:hypothetical protein